VKSRFVSRFYHLCDVLTLLATAINKKVVYSRQQIPCKYLEIFAPRFSGDRLSIAVQPPEGINADQK